MNSDCVYSLQTMKLRKLALCSHAVSRSFNHNSEPRSQSLYQPQEPHFKPTSVSRSFNHNSESWFQSLPTARTALCSHAVSRSFNTTASPDPRPYQPQEPHFKLTCSQSLFQSQQRVLVPVPTNRKNRTLLACSQSLFQYNSESPSQAVKSCSQSLFQYNSESRSQALILHATARTAL